MIIIIMKTSDHRETLRPRLHESEQKFERTNCFTCATVYTEPRKFCCSSKPVGFRGSRVNERRGIFAGICPFKKNCPEPSKRVLLCNILNAWWFQYTNQTINCIEMLQHKGNLVKETFHLSVTNINMAKRSINRIFKSQTMSIH